MSISATITHIKNKLKVKKVKPIPAFIKTNHHSK